MRRRVFACAALAFLVAAVPAAGGEGPAAEDSVAPGPPLREGEVIRFEALERLRAYLPPEFWAHRDFFFYAGMRLEIAALHRDYAPPTEWQEATRRHAGRARLGPDGSLQGYVAGEPFPMDQLDCTGDPQAGTKVIWNFDYRWEGDGRNAQFLYTYWDRGEKLPLYFEGTSKTVQLAHRVERQYLESQQGDLFPKERRKFAFGIEVEAPFDARGTKLLSYRYKDADAPLAASRNDDTWVYVPTLRRVRRISTAQRADAVSGTDFTFDDLFSFFGIVPQYQWTCLGEMELLAPVNSRVRAYPYSRDHDFGPYGLSYADDRWELRRALKIRMVPRNADHPYHHKDLYLDRQTLEPLYSFAYDRKQELWKVIWHNHRWSGDDPDWYHGWEGIAEPRDLRVVSDTVLNVQTGTGNRIEFWDNHGMPLGSRGKTRMYISVDRLLRRSN